MITAFALAISVRIPNTEHRQKLSLSALCAGSLERPNCMSTRYKFSGQVFSALSNGTSYQAGIHTAFTLQQETCVHISSFRASFVGCCIALFIYKLMACMQERQTNPGYPTRSDGNIAQTKVVIHILLTWFSACTMLVIVC